MEETTRMRKHRTHLCLLMINLFFKKRKMYIFIYLEYIDSI